MERLPRAKALAMTRSFFERKPEVVAKQLLGKLLVRKIGKSYYVGKIVETEAYLSENDMACHAAKGKTNRNHVMFGPAGHAYVYMVYGMYHCLNFVTESRHKPSAVLIRAVQPLAEIKSQISKVKIKEVLHKVGQYDFYSSSEIEKYNIRIRELQKLGSGPGKLCRWMKIDKKLNGIDLSKSTRKTRTSKTCTKIMDELFVSEEVVIENQGLKSEKITKKDIIQTTRIGVDYAGEHKDLLLRFYIKDNKFVSRK